MASKEQLIAKPRLHWGVIGSLMLLILLVPSSKYIGFGYVVHGNPIVPCYFVFGDSLYDVGNNNHLATMANSNYLPYGVDFPTGRPSGRFSNGLNTADFYAKLLGFTQLIPPYATATDAQIRQGVNYASGSGGIRDETSYTQGERVSMNLQLQNHQNVISRILRILGSKEAADRLLEQCIYTVGIGSNDYLNNYFLPQFYTTSKMYTPHQYTTVLIQQFSDQLMVLYNQGARKVALLGLSAVGCTPYAIETLGDDDRSPSPCVDSVNVAVQLFNEGLPALVDSFNLNFTGAHFTYIDNTNSLSIPNLIAAGFKVLNASCCERVRGQLQCVRLGKVCTERTEYLYWDGVHPTQAVASFIAQSTYSTNNVSSPSTAHPYDIQDFGSLAQLTYISHLFLNKPRIPRNSSVVSITKKKRNILRFI